VNKIYDKNISVNTEGMTDAQKKEVIDLFYDLGIKWYGSQYKYDNLYGVGFTNTESDGEKQEYLMWCGFPPKHAVVSVEELREIVKEWKVGGDMNKFKLGGVYKCGDDYVRIIADFSGDDKHHPSYYELVGIICDKHGNHGACRFGMFSKNDGGYCDLNCHELKHNLELVKEEPEVVELTLEQVASRLGVPVSSIRIKD